VTIEQGAVCPTCVVNLDLEYPRDDVAKIAGNELDHASKSAVALQSRLRILDVREVKA
jgi:hypothetical protein